MARWVPATKSARRTRLGGTGTTGTLEYTGSSGTINRAFNIVGGGGVIQIDNPNTNVTANNVGSNVL